MSNFNRALLRQIKESVFEKRAFIPSEKMQQQIAQAQEAGVIEPPPPEKSAQQPGQLEQIAGMMQEGFNAILQGQQQLAQMLQQIQAVGEKRKMTDKERIDRLEQMLESSMAPQGGNPAVMAGGVPPEGQMPPQQ
jgi:hypothetical protein